MRAEALAAGLERVEVGAAVAAPATALADPDVARAKFDREVEAYRQQADEYLRRGWMMVRAEFPEVTVIFAAPHLSPPSVLFGVIVDFSDYDYRPPSVRFVHPFTMEPLPYAAMPTRFPSRGPMTMVEVAPGIQAELPARGLDLLVAHPDGSAFLCIKGVREYHDNPLHTNEPWLAHRNGGYGRLAHILEVLYHHGVQPLVQHQFEVQVRPVGYAFDYTRAPE